MKSQGDIIEERRRIWERKPILRRLYHRWYRLIGEAIRPGRTLELGGGSGNLKEFFPGTITSDILFAPWLDVVLDAHFLPFKKESLDNIVLFDVLHHLSRPARFFGEAEKVLRPGGRVVMMEPYVSWFSYVVYRYFHPEGLDGKVDPYGEAFGGSGKEAFKGNQSIPSLMFIKYGRRFAREFPGFRVIRIDTMDFLVYPLSGGFHNPSLCPVFAFPMLERLERWLKPFRSFLAFRMLVVIEKRAK
ncbi:MAG: class I SAM-dependent methyltransferase [Deltaproteobacteria bacterium]|nr:class I SAM-dependent methyltransferase [Deltaproteobacteria bacterium]